MDFIDCPEKGQRVALAVCEHNVKEGKCTKDLLDCRKVKKPRQTPEHDLLKTQDPDPTPKPRRSRQTFTSTKPDSLTMIREITPGQLNLFTGKE